jgi:hypothetical protein
MGSLTRRIIGLILALLLVTSVWHPVLWAAPQVRLRVVRPTPVPINPTQSMLQRRVQMLSSNPVITLMPGTRFSMLPANAMMQMAALHRQAQLQRMMYNGAGYASAMSAYGGYANNYSMMAGGYGSSSSPMSSMPAGSYGAMSQMSSPSPYSPGSYYAPGYTTQTSSYAPDQSTTSPKEPSVAQEQGKLQQAQVSKLLTATGLSNLKGKVYWPLGLQVLQPNNENLELLDNIETLLHVAAGQQIAGRVNGNLLDEVQRDLDRLKAMLDRRRGTMLQSTVDEADKFLDKVHHAVTVLRPA